MKKALLIGGAGFIGHHLALALKQDGFDVAVIDGLEVNNSLEHSPRKEIKIGDILSVPAKA
jgi:nucleoside-diphosphate-sugar epimerase